MGATIRTSGVPMCVHVVCADELPGNTLVWARPQPVHIVVYIDSSLAAGPGVLTAEGIDLINASLAVLPGSPSLDSAKPCHEPLL